MTFGAVKIHYHRSMFCTDSRRLLAFAAVIPIACVLSSGGTAQVVDLKVQAQVQEHFLTAQQDQQEGRLDAAAHEYQIVLRLQPELPEAYVNLGLVYYAQSKFEDSARALAAAEKLRPGMHGVSLWLGIDAVRLNRPAQGAAFLREAVRQDPNEKLSEGWLGTALWDEGQIDAALVQLHKAATLFPDDPDLLFALGEAYGKAASEQTQQLLEESAGTALSDRIYGAIYVGEHDLTKAEGHLRRAIERDPHSVDARLELAGVLIEQANLPTAQEQLVQAAALVPHSPSVLAREGELLLLQQQPAEGLSSIEKALEIDPGEALDALGLPMEYRSDDTDGSAAGTRLSSLCRESLQALRADSSTSSARDVSIAALYALAGDNDAAARTYSHIVFPRSSLSPSANLFTQALRALHEHHYDEAEEKFLRWLAAHPSDRTARYDLVLARRQIFIAQVIRLYQVAPDSYHVHQLLGQLYASREEDDKALTEYLAVAAARPDLPGVHFWLGHFYWKHGDADHAITEFTRELELSPGHPEANAELGTVLVAEERAAEAIPRLQAAIRSKPDLWPAYAQLGRAYAMEKNYAEAEQMLKRVLTHDTDGSAHYELALVLRDEGKTAQAAEVFAQVKAIKNEKMAAPSTNHAADQGAKNGEALQ